jgi:hypothetical protein
LLVDAPLLPVEPVQNDGANSTQIETVLLSNNSSEASNSNSTETLIEHQPSPPASTPKQATTTTKIVVTEPTTTTMSPEAKKQEISKAVSGVLTSAREQRLAPNPDDIGRALKGQLDGVPCGFCIICISIFVLNKTILRR